MENPGQFQVEINNYGFDPDKVRAWIEIDLQRWRHSQTADPVPPAPDDRLG